MDATLPAIDAVQRQGEAALPRRAVLRRFAGQRAADPDADIVRRARRLQAGRDAGHAEQRGPPGERDATAVVITGHGTSGKPLDGSLDEDLT